MRSPRAEVRLISELESVQPGQSFWVAWYVKLSPKWHTYWKNPGDSGEPFRAVWKSSDSFHAGPLQFPFPKRIEQPPLANFGYEGEVLILAKIQASKDLNAGDPFKLEAQATWLVCEEECIPEKGNFELFLPVTANPGTASPWKTKILLALKTIPKPWPGPLPELKNASQGPLVKISRADAYLAGPVDFFPVVPGLIQNAAKPEVKREGSNLALQLRVGEIQKGPLEELQGILTGQDATGQAVAYEVRALIPAASVSPWIFVWAFLGGLLLNLMPCVFPVLSLKVLGFFHQSGRSPAKARRHAAAYAGGILISFWILAGVLGGLRWAGHQIGWGFQLQSPTFTLILIALLFLLGLSLLGVYSIGTSWMNWGHSLTQGKTYSSSFFSGLLATVVATPCMAPLVGSSLGVALTQNVFVSGMIFTCLALGLAAPYVLLGLFPRALRWLPKPGPWMLAFERIMGFLLLASVVWLLGVYAELTSLASLVWLLAALLGLSFALWLPLRSPFGKSFKVALALAALVLAWRNVRVESADVPAVSASESLKWEPYSEARLAELRDQSRAVFINFTAAWCLTCQVNERVALRSEPVQRAFSENEVTLLKADWTRQDPQIARSLQSYGRQGVPLYLLFGPDSQSSPKILPELLTPGIVLQALEGIDSNQ